MAAFVCGGSRIRTGDPMLAKHVLYQLSYTPEGCRLGRGCVGAKRPRHQASGRGVTFAARQKLESRKGRGVLEGLAPR